MTNDDLVQFGNAITALLERYGISDGKYWTQQLVDGTLRFRVEGTLPLTTMTDDLDIRRAEQRVAQAAIDYVDYFFPSSETGAGMDNTGGELIRAVRALQHVQATADEDGPRSCSRCGQASDSVGYESRYGRGLICQRCNDGEINLRALLGR
jgi:hypothetical protein